MYSKYTLKNISCAPKMKVTGSFLKFDWKLPSIHALRIKIMFGTFTSIQKSVRSLHFDAYFLNSFNFRFIHFDTFFTSTHSHRTKSQLRSFHFDSKFHVDSFTSIQKFYVDSFTSTETSFFQNLHFDTFISHRCCTSTYHALRYFTFEMYRREWVEVQFWSKCIVRSAKTPTCIEVHASLTK